jgi:hypothetical protein
MPQWAWGTTDVRPTGYPCDAYVLGIRVRWQLP